MTNCKKEEEPATTVTPTANGLVVDFSYTKKPVASSACGSLDAGLVGFTNLARNAKSIRWTFGDGTADATSTASYFEHQYTAKGTYTVTLAATDSTKTLTKVQTVTVLGEGCVVLHKTNTTATFPLKITLNGQEKTVNQGEVSCANCCTNAAQYGNSIAAFKAPYDRYDFTVKNSNGTIVTSSSATITRGQCTKVAL